MNGLNLPTDRGIERQLERLPVGVVPDLQPPGDNVERRAEAAGADDRPAVGVARDLDPLVSDDDRAREDGEAHVFSLGAWRVRAAGGRLLRDHPQQPARQQKDGQGGADTMAQEHGYHDFIT